MPKKKSSPRRPAAAAAKPKSAKPKAAAKKKAAARTPRKMAPPPENEHIIPDLRPLAVPCADLVLDPENARKHDEASIAAIKASLSKFKQRTPIVVNQSDRRVLKGNGTLAAARELGWETIAVVWVRDDPATATGYAIADNRSGELSAWDDAKLAELLETHNLAEADSELFAALQLDSLLGTEPAGGEGGDENLEIPATYQVVIECRNEKAQKKLYDRLVGEGLKVKLLTM